MVIGMAKENAAEWRQCDLQEEEDCDSLLQKILSCPLKPEDERFTEGTVRWLKSLFVENVGLIFSGSQVMIECADKKDFADIKASFFQDRFFKTISIDELLRGVEEIWDKLIKDFHLVMNILNSGGDPDEFGDIILDLKNLDRQEECFSLDDQQTKFYNAWKSLVDFLTTTNVANVPCATFERMLDECGFVSKRVTMWQYGEMRGRENYFDRKYPLRTPFDMTDEQMLTVDKDFWAQFNTWAKHDDSVVPLYYDCDSFAAVGLSTLDYLVLERVNIRRCRCCNQLFLPQSCGQERFCSDECRRENDRRRMAATRQSPLIKELTAIASMLSRRTGIEDEKEYKIFLAQKKDWLNKVRSGACSEAAALHWAQEEHKRLKENHHRAPPLIEHSR